MFRRTRRAIVATAAMAMSAVLVSSSVSAVTFERAALAAPTTQAATAATHVVTLITGDRVQVAQRTNGERQIAVERGAGRKHIQFMQQSGKDTTGQDRHWVIPADAAPLIAAGRLDAGLFDINGLIRDGHDDKSQPEVPLIVTYAPGVSARTATIPAATLRFELTSISGAALRSPKDQVGTFWKSITGSRGTAKTLPGGMTKIWLDGRAQLLDEDSNKQIGVPAAWQAGFTGKGVTVAVLDTGVDSTHPDLSNVVTEARDFTGSPDGAKDTHGHGTHVASIIAGSGSASSGKFGGVAPDAKLLVGRVCLNSGCPNSSIIAGMEWAANEKRAKVINMSLGTASGSDGTDPISQAVNNLTASSGSLFVISAGNSGDRPGTVGSPGAADAALTVGSVTREDGLSDFSSRGPRRRNFAVKPDITAPGEDIVAARAAGTSMGSPVNDHYTAASGTSMAAPHVTGAAAILAQAHPDWPAARLKTGLMSTAHPISATVYGQGAGRVDVGRAVTQTVNAEPASVSFGLLHWPFTSGQPISKTVTYRNDGEAAVTLTLFTSATDPVGNAAPAAAFTVSPSTVTVPAHGTAEVTLTETPSHFSPTSVGAYSGRLVAAGPDGIVVQTAFGLTTEFESYDITLKLLDRNGQAPDFALVSINLLDQRGGKESPELLRLNGTGTEVIRAIKGEYGAIALTIMGPGTETGSGTVAAVPKVMVDRDITLTFDGRQGRLVDGILDAPNPVRESGSIGAQVMVKTDSGDERAGLIVTGGPTNPLYAVPVRGDANFTFSFDSIVTEAGNGLDRVYYLAIPVSGRIPADPRFRLRDRDLHRSEVDYHTQGVDAAIADRVEFPWFLPGQTGSSAILLPTALPSRRLEFHSPAVRWSPNILQQYLPGGPRFFFEGMVVGPDTTYRAGESIFQGWNHAVSNADLLVGRETGNRIYRTGDRLISFVSSHSPGELNHTGGPVADIFTTSGASILTRDGIVVGRGFFPSLSSFSVPGDIGRYTLTLEANRSKPWTRLSTKVVTNWTFTSGPVEEETLQLPSVKINGFFDGRNHLKGGTRSAFLLTAGTQFGAAPSPVTVNSVELSGDDGVTWQPVPIRHLIGNLWLAFPDNPPANQGTGFVSLRLKAANAAGNTLEQTIVRAYGLTG